MSNFFIIQWIEKKLYVQYGSISSFQQVNLVDFYSFNIFYYESNWYSHAACLYRAPYLNINQKQMLVRQISHKKDFKCFRKLNWKSIIMSVRLMRRLINCLKFFYFSPHFNNTKNFFPLFADNLKSIFMSQSALPIFFFSLCADARGKWMKGTSPLELYWIC